MIYLLGLHRSSIVLFSQQMSTPPLAQVCEGTRPKTPVEAEHYFEDA